MRLSQKEITAIKQAVRQHDADALIYLFGSRTDDNARGGDIDLLIESTVIGFADKISIKVELYDLIGEQKIDLVLAKQNDPFTDMAKEQGVLL